MSLLMGVYGYFEHDAVISILTLVDTALIAVLMLIVVFSGYENFVSKLSIGARASSPLTVRHATSLRSTLGWAGSEDLSRSAGPTFERSFRPATDPLCLGSFQLR